jgi:parvulin-like peptidyl-prolyl isomerase
LKFETKTFTGGKMKKFLVYVGLGLLLLSVLCCGKKEKTIATVGNHKITVEDFNRQFNSQVPQNFTSPEQELTTRRNFLDRLVEGKLLVIAAYEQKQDTSSTLAKLVEEQKPGTLIGILYKKEVLDKSNPSEKDLKDYYRKMGEEVHARHIMVQDEKVAFDLYKKVKQGENFEKLAKEKSEDPTTKDKGGDLGFFTYDRMVPQISDVAYRMKPGEISKPLKTAYGWHIIKVEEKRKREQKPYEEMKEALKASYQRLRQQVLSSEYVQKLKTRVNFQMIPETEEKLLTHTRVQGLDSLTGKPLPPVPLDPAKVTKEEGGLILAKYKGGEIVVDTFLNELGKMPPYQMPQIKDKESLEQIAYNLSLTTLLAQDALKKKLDKSPEYKKALSDFKETKLSDYMRYGVIWKDIPVSDEEISKFYEENKLTYLEGAEVHLKEVLVRTKEEAEGIFSKVKSGADIGKLAQEKTLREYTKPAQGDMGFITRSRYPEIFDAAFALRKGQVGGPVHVIDPQYGEGYSVFKLMEKKEGRQKSLEEVKGLIRLRLQGEKKTKIFEDWLTQAKKNVPVKIYENVLASTVETKPVAVPPATEKK